MIALRHATIPAVFVAAFAVVVTACTVSENRFPLAVSAADAPKTWAPLRQCAQQKSYSVQDETTRSPPRLNLWLDAANSLEISYTLDGDHMSMDVVVWGEATDADRKRLIDDLHTKGNDVWTCAQQIGFH
jgi:hypothetical protein